MSAGSGSSSPEGASIVEAMQNSAAKKNFSVRVRQGIGKSEFQHATPHHRPRRDTMEQDTAAQIKWLRPMRLFFS